jgi:multiple sugar transport system permease protein/raffinose/stachyose/melibiose transport system permease protein
LNKIAPAAGKLVTTFVGLENYLEIFKDEIFFLAARNTLLWGAVGPTLEMLAAITLAMVVYFRVPFHRFYRVAWFTPILVSGVIIGLVFRWIFNYDWGILNVGLRAIGLDELALNWLGLRSTPIWAVIFVHFWATFGFSFVLLLAGLSAIPAELVEAAYIDGATRMRAIWHVLLPLLKPTVLTVLILSFMGKMHAFHVVWVLTNGGPLHFSETIATYVQKRAFGWSTYDLGYPSAISVIWFGITVIGVGAISRWLRPKVEI